MPTLKPRINVTFSEDDVEMIHTISLQMKMKPPELIRKVMEDWMEEYEDMILARHAEEAYKKFEKSGKKTISHGALWKKLNT